MITGAVVVNVVGCATTHFAVSIAGVAVHTAAVALALSAAAVDTRATPAVRRIVTGAATTRAAGARATNTGFIITTGVTALTVRRTGTGAARAHAPGAPTSPQTAAFAAGAGAIAVGWENFCAATCAIGAATNRGGTLVGVGTAP